MLSAILKSNQLFSSLTDEHLSFLLDSSVKFNFKKGDVIFKTGDNLDYLYFVLNGVAKLYNEKNNKQEIVCLVKEGHYFCIGPVFAEQISHISAAALSDVFALGIPVNSLLSLLKHEHEFSLKLVKVLAKQECNLCTSVCELSLNTAKSRLAGFILDEAGNMDEFLLTVNQTDLASLLGTVREVISRELRAFQEAGFIKFSRKKIKILDRDSLLRIHNM